MFFLKQHKMSITFMIVLLLFFVSASGVTVARAGSEEAAFFGKITAIDAESVTVRLTDQGLSKWRTGSHVKLVITEDTRVLRLIKNRLEDVPLKELKTGLLVYVAPNTLPNEDVEAIIIEIIKGAR